MDKFSELKAAAMAATPGPWGINRTGNTIVSNQSHPVATVSDAFHRQLAGGGVGKDAEFIAAANPSAVLELLAELEAKDKRIAELESIRADASQVFKEIGNELGCNPDNESIMMAIDALKERLATPVRLQSPWVDKVGNRWLLEGTTADVIRAAGLVVTVQGVSR
ncbi:ead/Ea22-like family protein [Serratia marcescens]|uniref:ead/Ea22-like family protein n=1 Tax=Serratia marcescens TaxID=615 RepID=UPI000E70B913|nr:ead/Ea22-like family protein [Serratia marcescens]RJY02616.1 ead/Ea22-like family protein [Serratia marcescens]